MTTILLILLWGCTLFVTGTICWFKGFKRGKNGTSQSQVLKELLEDYKKNIPENGQNKPN